MPHPYANAADLKARLALTNDNAARDDILERALVAASVAIDHWCRRRFYRATETRYYDPEWGDLLVVDDLATITTLKTDDDGDRTYETTWASTDYDLEPANAVTDGGAYTRIRIRPNGRYGFPVARRSVEIVGSFGYAAEPPSAIAEACLVYASRLYQRRQAPLGVAGGGDFGLSTLLPSRDPDVVALLSPYKRPLLGVA